MKTFIYFLFFNLVAFSSFAQEVTVQRFPTNSIRDLFYLSAQNEPIAVVSNPIIRNLKQAKSNNFQDALFFQEELRFSNGKIYKLKTGEIVTTIKYDILITQEDDIENEIRVFRRYAIVQNSVELKVTYKGSSYNSASILNKRLTLISDSYENYGEEFILLDQNMVVLKKLKPFKTGYTSFLKDVNQNIIHLLFQKDPSENLTYLQLKEDNLEIKRQFEIPLKNFVPLRFFVSNENLVLFGNNTIAVINSTGQIKWQKNLLLPNVDIFTLNGKKNILAVTDNDIVSFKVSDGKEVFKIPLNNLIGDVKQLSLSPQKLRVLSSTSIKSNDNLGFVLGYADPGYLDPNTEKQNVFFLLLNFEGKILRKSMLDGENGKIFRLVETPEHILILKDNKTYSYEKK